MSKIRTIKTIICKCGHVDNYDKTISFIRTNQRLNINDCQIFKFIPYCFILYIEPNLFYSKGLNYDTALIENSGLVKLKIVRVTDQDFAYVQYDNHNKCVITSLKKYSDIGMPIVKDNVIFDFKGGNNGNC